MCVDLSLVIELKVCSGVTPPHPACLLSPFAPENEQRQLAEVDRCKCEGITKGFAKITVEKNSGGKILGATVVGPNAGSMISELTICIQVTRAVIAVRLPLSIPLA